MYRFTFGGKVTETGLGSADIVSLAEARDKAHAARKQVRAGENPIQTKRRAATIAAGKPTFGAVADALIASKQTEWRNEKHRAQSCMTLSQYAKPLRPRPVNEIDFGDEGRQIWSSTTRPGPMDRPFAYLNKPATEAEPLLSVLGASAFPIY